MGVHNSEIRDIFNQTADLMEIKGENPFRVRAYREAARVVEGMAEQMEKLVSDDEDLTSYRGIGKELAGKIREIVETGGLSYLEELKAEVPASLLDLLAIPALGPKKVSALYYKLGITNVQELKAAAREGNIARLEGFGKKSQAKILESIGQVKKESAGRMLLSEAEAPAAALESYLSSLDGIKQTAVAGSFRRGRETIGDLDILASCERGFEKQLMQAFVDFEDVLRIDSHGSTKSSVHLRSGLQVDLRIVDQESYGAALHYFTGSKAHNVAVRKIAAEKGLKINEYGVYRGDEKIAGETEKDVYEAAGLCYIEPELRENMGEIEAALSGTLPRLVSLSDIKGDLHTHTTRTDGRSSLREMAEAARKYGYEYMAVTEHSQMVSMAGGLNEKQVMEHMAEIERINEEFKGITLLKGMEVDIRRDGSLDLDDNVLKELDFTVCSIHYHQRLGRKEQTERVIRAMDNPHLHILGHPSGRLLNKREPMDIDLESVIEAAVQRRVVIELNAQPERLDLAHNYCKTAAEKGARIAVSTDAHSSDNLKFMRNGVTEARRGWLTKNDVVNTLPLKDLLKALRRS